MGLTVNDLTSKYQEKVNNYNNMIATMPDDIKKTFNIAINVYDVLKREQLYESYVGYALKTLAMMGHYYDVKNGKWGECSTKQAYENSNSGEAEDVESNYRGYIRKLYPRENCQKIGIDCWDIVDAQPDLGVIEKVNKGEMAYEYFDLEFNVSDEFGGEQQTTQKKKDAITIPPIPISPNVDIKEMTKGDKSNDKFIYAYTDSGVSKNKRDWRPMIMDSIAQQVLDNCPPGNLGHVKPKDAGFELPLPVITWIGATTEMLPDGKNKRLWLKGYVIPVEQGNQLKTFIKAKAIDSISVYGGLSLLPNEETGISAVLDCDLKSIDISGKMKQGLNSGIVKLAGEMQDNSSANEDIITNNKKEEHKMDLTNLTVADLKVGNPKLYGEMQADIISNMQTEENQKIIATKAGEMDALTTQYGDVKKTISSYETFAGEMAEAVGVAPVGGAIDFKSVIDKVKENVSKVAEVTKALKPAEGQDIVAKANEIAENQRIADNTKAIEAVNTKFGELTSAITNEAVKNLVAMQYTDILNAKPEAIANDYQTVSIAKLEAEVPNTIQSVMTQAQSLMQTGQQAGEMQIIDSLGVGAGAGASTQQKSVEKMTDEEYAKYLGY